MSATLTPRAEIQIAGRWIGADRPPYLIAEMSCGHQGKFDEAEQLVEVAADAGADAVQFEIFRSPQNMVPHAPNYGLITRLEFTDAQWTQLYAQARKRGIAVIGYAYDMPSLALALALKSDAIKLNASDLCNPEMIQGAARSGLPVTLGTGAATQDEVAEAVAIALAHGGDQLVLMHGVQNFPTQAADAYIRRIEVLRRGFGCLVGYADHTDATDPLARVVDLMALGAGACVLEKHVIVSRGGGRIDAAAALEPEEFKQYIALLRSAGPALGPSRLKTLGPSDEKYRRFQRKIIVATRDLAAGESLAAADIAFMRHHEPGVAPTRAPELLGRKLAGAVKRWQPVLPQDLA